MDAGFAMAGYSPIFGNDIDGDALKTNELLLERLSQHHSHLRRTNHEFALGSIRDVDLPDRGSADLLIGGPPCQGFSVAGRMNPDDPRSRHVFDFMGAVQRLAPEIFVMENVKALAMNRRWSGVLEKLVERSRLLGYEPAVHVLNAADYGVPQARERMFLIGTKSGSALPRPTPVSEQSRLTLRQAVSTLPKWGESGNDSMCTAKVTAARNPVLRRSPWAGMLFNGQGRPMNLDAPAPTLPASMGGNRTPIIDQKHLDQPDVEPWVVGYHRRLWNGAAPITNVPKRLRRITVEEAAAIQTFPIDTPWQGTQSSKYRQIGNAVPPTLAYEVATAILDHFGISREDSSDAVLNRAA